MHHKIPATIITGFLGSGKTTMVRHVLQNAAGKRIALIINEFGDIGVDGGLLKGCGISGCSDDNMIELSNGCICCTVADDFIPSMTSLIERDTPPEHILIETSGLALPQPLIRAFNWPEIRNRVTIDGIIALVDAAALSEGHFANNEEHVKSQQQNDDSLDHATPLSELFEDQLTSADIVVLNKIDLVSKQNLQDITNTITKQTRQGVQIIKASHGALPLEALLGLEKQAETDIKARHEINHHHHHEHENIHDEHDHHHDHHSHDNHGHDAFESFQISFGTISHLDDFITKLEHTIQTFDILRLKGFASVANKPMRLVIQAVGPRIEHYFDRPKETSEQDKTELTVIGFAGLDHQAIEKALLSSVMDQKIAS
ncbi:MAG: cobalamin biosynthesis protein CobW [Pseudomonadota bacterium]